MRDISPALASHLASGVTTLCRCWRLTRRDGVVMGFTDHDRDLDFDGVTFSASSGLNASEAESGLGMKVLGSEVGGALTDARITEADIASGLYDDTEISAFLVNWSDVAQRLTLDVGTVGEIRRADGTFVAELRGPMHRLDQERGRLFQGDCDADLGDARCKILTATYTTGSSVADTDGRRTLIAAGLESVPANWFRGGTLTFTSGANTGQQRMIQSHAGAGAIELWEPVIHDIAVGDTISLLAGCDKRFETCQAKFANTINFRGFPHIPTPDFILTYARSGEGGHDGGLLNP